MNLTNLKFLMAITTYHSEIEGKQKPILALPLYPWDENNFNLSAPYKHKNATEVYSILL